VRPFIAGEIKSVHPGEIIGIRNRAPQATGCIRTRVEIAVKRQFGRI
jgi:hypothetical protein